MSYRTNLTPSKLKSVIILSISLLLIVLYFNINRITQLRDDLLIAPVLFLPDKDFLLSRDQLVQQIEDLFKQQTSVIQSVVLAGPGGAGKTTLARLYGRTQRFAMVWEINAERRDSVINSFNDLAFALATTIEQQKELALIQIIQDTLKKEKAIINFVKRLLKDLPNWLLIYDNVENFMEIKDYLPQDANSWGTGRVLVTTRDLNIANMSNEKVLALRELKPYEASELFCKILYNAPSKNIRADEKEKIYKFLSELPLFPLDIATAAYYIKNTGIAYQEYLQAINNVTSDFAIAQETILKKECSYSKSRYGIVFLALKQLLSINKDFKELLLLISFLDSQKIPQDLLYKYKDKEIVDKFIFFLKKYSLITAENFALHSAIPVLSLHRSIQNISLTYLKKSLHPEEYIQLSQSIADNLRNYILDIMDREDFSRIKILVPHYEAVLSHNILPNDNIKGSIGSLLGCMYYYLGLDVIAKNTIEENLILLNKDPTKNSLEIANALLHLGTIYRMLGLFDKAKSVLEKSLKIYKTHPEHPTYTARALSYLGIVYRHLDQYEGARLLLEQSFDLYKKNAEYHVGNARTLAYLGIIYRELGDFGKSKSLLEKSLFVYEKHPEHHVGFAWSLVHLGNVYRESGDYVKARELLENSIQIYKSHFPDDYVDIGWALVHLGWVYTELGMYEQAEHVLGESIRIQKKYYSEDHADIAWASVFLGNVYREQGNYKEAKNVLEQSLVIYKKHYSEKTVDVAWAITYLGNLYSNMEEFTKAKKLLEDSLIVHKKLFGEDNIRTAWVLVHLGNLYKDIGELSKAKSILEQCLKIYERYFGKTHIQSARIVSSLGEVYLLKGDLDNAYTLLNKALLIMQQNKHPEVYISLERLAYLFKRKSMKALNNGENTQSSKFMDQAIYYTKQALETVKTHFPMSSSHIARIQAMLNGF